MSHPATTTMHRATPDGAVGPSAVLSLVVGAPPTQRRSASVEFSAPGALAGGAAEDAATITAQEMTRLTGVARERLRTWERRHGFPVALRSRNGVRRYGVDDVRHVAAVSQLATAGMPLAEAIETALQRGHLPGTLDSLGAALDRLPAPAIALSGPAPLRVVWANATTRMAPNGPAIGAELTDRDPMLGHSAREAVCRMLATDEIETRIIEHADWMGAVPVTRRSLAWRLASVITGEPAVVLLQLPDLDVTTASSAGDYGEGAAAWAAGLAAARRALQGGAGLSSLQHALRSLVDESPGSDGFLALVHGPQIRSATSTRGLIAPRTSARSACPEVERAIADGSVDWLGEESLAIFGIDPRHTAAVVPLVASGQSLGAAVLVFSTPVGLREAVRELLSAFGVMAACALLRERDARDLSVRSTRVPSSAGRGRTTLRIDGGAGITRKVA